MRRRLNLCLGSLAFALPLAASMAYAQPKAAVIGPKASPAVAGSSAAPSAPPASAPTTASPIASAAASAPQSAAMPVTPAASMKADVGAKPADPGITGATYAVRLRDLEQRVDELKDQIRRSHTRLAMISDTILSGGAAGSRAEVDFKDEMSSAFQLTHALFVIDNQVQYNKQDDSGTLADQKEIPIYTGSVPPGDHTIQVSLTFQGNGYGVFSYLRGYKFEVKSSHSFTAVEGKALTVTATAFEKGGVTTPLEQRPTIEWHESLKPFAAGVGAGSAPPLSGAPGAAAVSGGVSVGGGKK
jgi:hypothetical protein